MNRDVIPCWRNKLTQEIRRRDVIELLDEVQDRGSPIMANRVLAAVRRMFVWCVERGIIEASPCAGIRPPAVERSRDRVLSDDELRDVWLATEKVGWPFGPLAKLLILTGQRLNEVSRMRWAEIDMDAHVWTIPRERTKNDIAHNVPLSSQSLAVLHALPVIPSNAGLVFTTTGYSSVGGFSRAKTRIDGAIARARASSEPLLRWTFHDLRRTVASGMARLRIDIHVVEKVLNHSSGSFAGIVGVYQRHTFADEKREALQAWGNFVQQLIGAQPAAEPDFDHKLERHAYYV
jgi:integrase